ncbi:MAG: FecR domain-containing protein [Steroidobacteraceae bacterium]
MNVQIYEEASDWIVRHRETALDERERREFDRWLRRSPQHVCAYLEMSSMWEDLSALGDDWNPVAGDLIKKARSEDNVTPISVSAAAAASAPVVASPARRDGNADSGPGHRRAGMFYALAASMLLASICMGWFYSQRGIYETGIGEQRSLTLADGSMAELNARSRIKVRYSDSGRYIDLLEGQALFRVAKNKRRPFIVRTGDTQVRAVGTSFDVNRTGSGTVVTVLEGRIAVHAIQHPIVPAVVAERGVSARIDGTSIGAGAEAGGGGYSSTSGINAEANEILIAAGEQIVVTPEQIVAPRVTNVAAATAWTQHNLVFDAAPLAQVVEEFNRYNSRRLVIEDAELADLHVSGVFSSVDPGLLVRFLRAQPELAIDELGAEIRIRKK